MFRHLRKAIALAALPAALLLLGFTQQDNSAPQPSSANNDYPVILVHGLGGGPGEATFGKLQEYLEDFYYTVEVMDFNNYGGKKFARGNDAGNLGTQAAALGNFISDVMKKHKADKVNIIAHSYGGLIVHAYLNDFGVEYDKKAGGFDDNVGKVYYIQVPFYGSAADEETLTALIEATDYGRFLNVKEMLATLQVGSENIYLLDKATRENNVYSFVDAVTIASDEDEVVQDIMASLRGTLDVVRPFNRLRILQKYSHSVLNVSESKRGPFCYVESPEDRSFISIASFLDGGRNWRRIGIPGPIDIGMLLVRIDPHKSMKSLKADDVTLELNKKASVNTPRAKAKAIEGILNEDARVFAFLGLEPGDYTLTVKGKSTIKEKVEIGGTDQLAYIYTPADNKLNLVGLAGLLSLPQVTFGSSRTTTVYPMSALNVESFDVEFILQGATSAGIDEGFIFGLYNSKGEVGGNIDDNGSRLDLATRGDVAADNAGKIMITINIDKNNNGVSEPNEYEFIKSGSKFNWQGTNAIKLSVRREGTNSTRFKVWVNGNLVINTDGQGGVYRNAAPVLHMGGAATKEQQPLPGATIKNFVIKNGTAK